LLGVAMKYPRVRTMWKWHGNPYRTRRPKKEGAMAGEYG